MTTDVVGSLVNYGALGVFAIVLIYVVKSLDERNVRNYESRLAEKDQQIVQQGEMIHRLQDVLVNHVVPAMAKGTQVLEAIPNNDTLALARLDEIVTRLEGKGL